MTAAPDRRSARWSAAIALGLVAAAGLGGTALAATALAHAERDRLSRALQQRTAMIAQAVSAEATRYSTSMSDLAAAVGAQARLEAAEFTAITAAVDQRRLPGATGLSLVVRSDDVAGVQRTWRQQGAAGLTLRPTGNGPHWFAVLNKSLDDTGSTAGLDLSGSAQAVEAMRLAEEGHRIVVSRTYRLLKDADLPPGRRQLSFLYAAPVYATSPDAVDNGRFRGWLVLGIRGPDFLRETVAGAAGDAVAVTLLDDGQEVASWQPDVPAGEGLADASVRVQQRTWELRVRATQRLLTGVDRGLDRVAWLIGLVLTALLLALTATIVTSRNRALRRVEAATAALRDDIRRREEVEHRLRQREKELVGFAGVVAHDLSSPLARILGYADFLREEAFDRLDDAERDFLDRLRTGAHHMRVLIDDLLGYATADNRPITRAPVDLGRLADEIAQDRSAERRAEVIVDDLPTVSGDPTLLRQVLDNLIGNAVKYTPPERTPRIRVRAHPLDADRWRCEVVDNGIGIPPDERDGVFDAFTRASGSEHYTGTGLGLAIVHRIVERHGGQVGIDPNPDGGSIFWFTLPRHERLLAARHSGTAVCFGEGDAT